MPSALLWAYSAEKYFLERNPGKSADFPGLHFHGRKKRSAPYGADLLMFKKER